MTEHDLKEMKNLGAELGAAKAENEKLRGLLTTLRISLNLDDTEYGLSKQEKSSLAADIDAELSRQAKPTDTYTAVDMATAAAQGFRDGQAAVEPAPAQDEREAPIVVATAILGGIYHGGSGPELGEIDIDVCMPALETIQCETVNCSDDVFLPLMTVAQHERIVAALPAQQSAPKCSTCNDVGVVGHSMICPECEETWTPSVEPIEQVAAQTVYVECRECSGCGHVGINDSLETNAACSRCAWIGPSPAEDTCPGCAADNAMSAACPKCGCIYRLLADAEIATRPAQTEQQPVGYQFQDREGVWKQFMSEKHYEDTLADGTWPIRAIYAAPIAQTAPLKPHQLRELVNDLRDVARKYHATEQLREQIASTLSAAMSAQGAGDADS